MRPKKFCTRFTKNKCLLFSKPEVLYNHNKKQPNRKKLHMAKLNFHELINFFWNRDDFAVTAFQSAAHIFKKGDDVNGDPYYLLIKANGDLVESIDFYTIKMNHMKMGEGDSKYVKAFSFDPCDIKSIEHLVDVCKNTFDQMVVEEIRYLQQQMNKMNKLLFY